MYKEENIENLENLILCTCFISQYLKFLIKVPEVVLEMVEVEKKIRVHNNGEVVESIALFDTYQEGVILVKILLRKMVQTLRKIKRNTVS